MALTKAEKLKRCVGCRDNFYNGNNPMGIKECWMLATAKTAQLKFVPISLPPPWSVCPTEVTNSCHRKEGCVRMTPAQTAAADRRAREA